MAREKNWMEVDAMHVAHILTHWHAAERGQETQLVLVVITVIPTTGMLKTPESDRTIFRTAGLVRSK